MFGLGLPEMIVILVIGVLLFGPRRLPEIGNAVGKAIREFKNSIDGAGESQEKPGDPHP